MKNAVKKRPKKKKDPELWILISEAISNGDYVFVTHAKDRLKERSITDIEVLDILENKEHRERKRNKVKDTYLDGYQDWNYCIEGLDLDREKIRIIFSFNDALMLVITVIRLDQSE